MRPVKTDVQFSSPLIYFPQLQKMLTSIKLLDPEIFSCNFTPFLKQLLPKQHAENAS